MVARSVSLRLLPVRSTLLCEDKRLSLLAIGERWRRLPVLSSALFLLGSRHNGSSRKLCTVPPGCRLGMSDEDNVSVLTPSGGPCGDALRLLMLCGPSGVGKGTLCSLLLSDAHLGQRFAFSTSHTSRSPRPGEVDGEHYHFVSDAVFAAMVSRGEFLEYTRAPHGVWYGTSTTELRRLNQAGKVALLDVDLAGVRDIRAAATAANTREAMRRGGNAESVVDLDVCSQSRSVIDVRCVGIIPPGPGFGLVALEERLRARETESEEQIQKRLERAGGEIQVCTTERFMVDACIVNKDSWKIGFPELKRLILEYWPQLGL